jgi:hypothetical protein
LEVIINKLDGGLCRSEYLRPLARLAEAQTCGQA